MSGTAASPVVQSFLDRLDGVKRTGAGWQARCPCRNDDQNPSLSVGQGNDGRVLVTCHRGASACGVEQICESVGIAMTDLYPPTEKVKRKLELVASYDYRDARGKLLFQKQRFVDENGKKTFRQRRPDPGNGGWVFNLDGVDKVLYRLPQVLDAVRRDECVWVVEGEKDVDNLVAAGVCATTMPGGAGKWLDIHSEALTNALVFVVSDNDTVGREHAMMVANELNKVGARVTLWRPPDGCKDVSDLLAATDSLDTLVEIDPNEMIPVMAEAPDEAEQPEETDSPVSPLSGLLEQLTEVFGRENITDNVKLSRASLLIGSFGNEDYVDKGKLVQWQQFLETETDQEYDWVIPNLLERGERVIVVAAEGVGKTMLARQVAILSAAGLHPFTFEQIPPIRTLTIDLENPERIIRRSSASIMGAARRYGHKQVVDAHLLIKPSGVDLMRNSDKAIIEEAVEKIRPDLLVLGPIYKSFVDPGGRTSEAITVEVAKYFDMLRDYYKCALWLEHHAPLGSSMSTRDLRPFGSAVWSRWPEFGLSLQPDPTAPMGSYIYDVKHFRGARDQRKFPTKMTRGKIFPFEVLEYMKVDDA